MLVKKLVRNFDNLPWLAQEGRSSLWPLLSQSSSYSIISYSTHDYHLRPSSPSLSKPWSSVCYQGDVWYVLYVAFNYIDKPDKIVRVTGLRVAFQYLKDQLWQSWLKFAFKYLNWNCYKTLHQHSIQQAPTGYSSDSPSSKGMPFFYLLCHFMVSLNPRTTRLK